MARFLLATMLAFGAASAVAQTSSTAVELQPAVDSADRRQALRAFSNCLAEARPRWARQTLSHPYLSANQARVAAEVLTGRDRCSGEDDVEVTLRTSSMVGNLAEHFLQADIGQVDLDHLGLALNNAEPLNSSEDFALCVASRDPAAARDLVLSDYGSPQELEAGRRLAVHLAPCMRRGEDLTVDLQALRSLTSTALYRGMRMVVAARD